MSSLFEPVQTLQTHIYILAQEAVSADAMQQAWGAALVLVMIVFSFNALVLVIRNRRHTEALR